MRLFVDNLTNIDFSYLDSERGLVGETWQANIELQGELDDQGMVCDFGDVKRTLRNWLDTQIDHRLLVPTQAENINLQINPEITEIAWQFAQQRLTTTSPSESILLVPDRTICEASLARWCIEQLMPQFPASVATLRLTFVAEQIDGPFYHYSHGLKKHGGNCQRIAHGHRSRIEIWRNGSLSKTDMVDWAKKWQDIYLGTYEDIIRNEHQADHYSFGYTALQGLFKLTIPKDRVYLIETDTTVEFIAQHIAQQLKARHPNDNFVVKAYEGLNKGAIAEA